jgi:hypothetical protein
MNNMKNVFVNKIADLTVKIKLGLLDILKTVNKTLVALINKWKYFNIEEIENCQRVYKVKLTALEKKIEFPCRHSVIARSFIPYGDFDYETGFL